MMVMLTYENVKILKNASNVANSTPYVVVNE